MENSLDAGSSYGDVTAALDYFEQVPMMACVLDRELRLVAANTAYRITFGSRIAYGVNVFEGMDEAVPQGFEEALRRVATTGEPFVVTEQRLDLESGRGQHETMWIDLSYYPWRDDDGELNGAFCLALDVSAKVAARQKAEAELAVVAAEYERSRQAIVGLQRSLLPDRVPVLPGLDIAASYILAGSDDAAGGDWFDVVTRDDGTVVLAVGDVVGHGIGAAATMGRLRAVLVHLLETGASIESAVRSLDGHARRHPEALATTVCLVDLDPASGAFTHITAGHPPPVIVDLSADESDAASFVVPSGGVPLGTGEVGAPGTGTLEDGEILVLYTDGAIERPGRSASQGTVELGRVLHRAGNDRLYPADQNPVAVDRAVIHTIRQLERTSAHSDDTTLLAVRRNRPPAPLDVQVRADATAPVAVSAEVLAWLGPVLAGRSVLGTIDHIVTELVQNIVDHAYVGRAPGAVHTEARIDPDGTLVLEVRDDGTWIPPRPRGDRGRGIALVRQLADELTVDGSDDGTVATVRHRLHRPATLLDEAPSAVAEHPGVFDVHSDPGRADGTVYLQGPVDQRAVDELRAHLALRLTEVATELTVDLSSVSMLTSAGISVLFEARKRADEAGIALHLRAPVGSPAHQVLTLVGLPATPMATDRR